MGGKGGDRFTWFGIGLTQALVKAPDFHYVEG